MQGAIEEVELELVSAPSRWEVFGHQVCRFEAVRVGAPAERFNVVVSEPEAAAEMMESLPGSRLLVTGQALEEGLPYDEDEKGELVWLPRAVLVEELEYTM